MYIPRGVRYGTVRRYVLLGMGTVCRYVLLGTGTVRVRYGYGTWVRYVGTVRGYTVQVRRTYGPYPRTVPVPYPHRTRIRIVPVPSVRTHGTYPPYVPVPTPKSYPVLGSPGTR